jgi:hypothetical protein
MGGAERVISRRDGSCVPAGSLSAPKKTRAKGDAFRQSPPAREAHYMESANKMCPLKLMFAHVIMGTLQGCYKNSS